jgi:hypothetical protein
MGFKLYHAVMARPKPEGVAARLLLGYLAILVDDVDKESECWPDIPTLAFILGGVKHTYVHRLLRELEKAKFIKIRFGKNRRRAGYRVIFPADSKGEQKFTVNNSSQQTCEQEFTTCEQWFTECAQEFKPHIFKTTITTKTTGERRTPNKKSASRQPNSTRPDRTPPPEKFAITDRMREWANQEGITALLARTGTTLEQETEHMLDHFRAKGEYKADWTATWRTWMRNVRKFGGTRGRAEYESNEERKSRKTRENRESLLRDIAAGNDGASGRRGVGQGSNGDLSGEIIEIRPRRH